MKDSFGKNAKNFINNPIGLMGLCLVLVEGIAALVIGLSNLDFVLNLILVLFVAIYPCIVLAVFFRLVSKYHKNLYAPSDFRNEENFEKTYTEQTVPNSSDSVLTSKYAENQKTTPANMKCKEFEKEIDAINCTNCVLLKKDAHDKITLTDFFENSENMAANIAENKADKV